MTHLIVVVCMVRIIVWWRYCVYFSNSETYSNLVPYSTSIENQLLLQWLCGCCDIPESGSSLSQSRDLPSALSRWTKSVEKKTCHNESGFFAMDFNLLSLQKLLVLLSVRGLIDNNCFGILLIILPTCSVNPVTVVTMHSWLVVIQVYFNGMGTIALVTKS